MTDEQQEMIDDLDRLSYKVCTVEPKFVRDVLANYITILRKIVNDLEHYSEDKDKSA